MRCKKSVCRLAVLCLVASLLALPACQGTESDSAEFHKNTGASQTSPSTKPTVVPTDPVPSVSVPTESTPTPSTPTPSESVPSETQPVPPAPTEPAEAWIPIGLEHLRAQPNADAMVALYYEVEEACQTLQQDLSVSNLNLQEVTMVLNHYRQDHPESFWFSSKFQYSTLNGKIFSLTLLYDDSDLVSVQFGQDMVEGVVEEMLGLLREDMSDYEKALTLYDALIDRCDYEISAPNAHNLYGALVEGQAVCEGYALAYQYLLMRAGIPAMYVTGFSREDHAWNAMQLDGQWYYADATWDDPKGNDGTFRYYGYFGLTREMMDWDHEAYEETIPLPEANSMDCNYYHRIEHIVTEFDLEQVKQWMMEGDTLRIYVQGQTQEYLNVLRANITRIVIEADLPWNGYVYTVNGREIIFQFH